MTANRWAIGGTAVAVVAIAVWAVVASSGEPQAISAAAQPQTSTALVNRGTLSAIVSLDGTLTLRARADGLPYTAVNRASGTYTDLPDAGNRVACGHQLYRVNDKAVLLLCGTVPTYRDLHVGDTGNDVRQLNTNLHDLGYAAAAGVTIDPASTQFTEQTASALEKLQSATGLDATGALSIGGVVFLPESAQVVKVTAALGGAAQAGAPVLDATSDTPQVQVALDASQQGAVNQGARAQITLPGNRSVKGVVERLGRVAQAVTAQDGQSRNASSATINAYLTLDDPTAARGLDQAPVQVEIATKGVKDALSVPVTAIVGRSGGGYAVEVVGSRGRRRLVAVKLGLFDTTAGRVQVTGELDEHDRVVVPSS